MSEGKYNREHGNRGVYSRGDTDQTTRRIIEEALNPDEEGAAPEDKKQSSGDGKTSLDGKVEKD